MLFDWAVARTLGYNQAHSSLRCAAFTWVDDCAFLTYADPRHLTVPTISFPMRTISFFKFSYLSECPQSPCDNFNCFGKSRMATSCDLSRHAYLDGRRSYFASVNAVICCYIRQEVSVLLCRMLKWFAIAVLWLSNRLLKLNGEAESVSTLAFQWWQNIQHCFSFEVFSIMPGLPHFIRITKFISS